MATYTLRAHYPRSTSPTYRRHRFEADSDFEATLAGTSLVMYLAAHGSPVWRRGEISLIDPDGNIVRTLPPTQTKEQS